MAAKPFDEWWDQVVSALDTARTIRNWTAQNGFAISGKFDAISYRVLKDDLKRHLTGGHPFSAPNQWIVCTQVKGDSVTMVSRKEFKDRYIKWKSYRINGITRKHFGGDNNASPYLISIFKEFDYLVDS